MPEEIGRTNGQEITSRKPSELMQTLLKTLVDRTKVFDTYLRQVIERHNEMAFQFMALLEILREKNIMTDEEINDRLERIRKEQQNLKEDKTSQ